MVEWLKNITSDDKVKDLTFAAIGAVIGATIIGFIKKDEGKDD